LVNPAVDVANLADTIARYRAELEAFLRAAVPFDRDAPELYQIIRYHLGWLDENLRPIAPRGGKLLRPTICLLACEAAGGDYRRALPAAAAVELLHNFSLIHDDVEDRGAERRGRATVWARWGEPIAVNAGDALLIVSELALLRSGDVGVEPEATLKLVRLLNECCLRLTEGQHLDISNEGNTAMSVDEYERMIAGKTAALLGCAAQLGAVAAGASDPQSRVFRRFGELIGLAFQIQDDVLGIWGDPRETGKAAAADVYGRKVTLPIIDAISRVPADVAGRIITLYSRSAPGDAEVSEVIRLLDGLGARNRAEKRASRYLEEALTVLSTASPAPGPASALRSLAGSLVGRKT
jgi:geranylgeranyl diphosphate synthase type I